MQFQSLIDPAAGVLVVCYDLDIYTFYRCVALGCHTVVGCLALQLEDPSFCAEIVKCCQCLCQLSSDTLTSVVSLKTCTRISSCLVTCTQYDRWGVLFLLFGDILYCL